VSILQDNSQCEYHDTFDCRKDLLAHNPEVALQSCTIQDSKLMTECYRVAG